MSFVLVALFVVMVVVIAGILGTLASLFLVEERETGFGRIELGARVERNRSNPDTLAARSFTPVSLSVGSIIDVGEAHHVRLLASRSQRAPAAEELFAAGRHAAAGTFEIGGGFSADGYLVVSDQTFLRLFPARLPGAPNYVLLRLAPGAAEIVDQVPFGRLYKDGRLVGTDEEMGIRDRRKLSYVGHVAVNVVLDDRHELAGDPDLVSIGTAAANARGVPLEDLMLDAAIGAVESIPRVRRKDLDLVAESVRRAVRAAANEAWGKKPLVTVFVTR